MVVVHLRRMYKLLIILDLVEVPMLLRDQELVEMDAFGLDMKHHQVSGN